MKTGKKRILTTVISAAMILMTAVVFCSSAMPELNAPPKFPSVACGDFAQVDGVSLIVSCEHLILSEQNPTDNTVTVTTEDEFKQALEQFPALNRIEVTADITLTGDIVCIPYGLTVSIAEGVTLTCDGMNLLFSGNLVNNGTILTNCAHFGFYMEPEKLGLVVGQVYFQGVFITVDSLERYLSPDSPYTSIACVQTDSTLVIDRDLTVPVGKTLWLNGFTKLQINAGATLTVEGTCEMFGVPVCDGQIIGTIKNLSQSRL